MKKIFILLLAPLFTYSQVILDGSASTGQELTYSWRQLSGPVTNIIDSNKVRASVNVFLPGNYLYELKVKDKNDNQSRDTVKVLALYLIIEQEIIYGRKIYK